MERIVLTLVVLALAVTACTEPATTGFISDDKNPWLKKAEAEKQQRNYAQAVECYEQALKLNPDSAAIHWAVAILDEQQLKDLASAIYHYQRFVKLNTDPERVKMANVFIERAKRSLIASMPNSPLENASEMNDLLQKNRALQDEVDKLRQQLTEAQMRLANQPQTAAAAPPPPPLEPNVAPAVSNTIAMATPPPAPANTTAVATHKPAPPAQTPSAAPQTPAVNPRKTTTYKVKHGDTLASIALKYYGDRNAWGVLYRANRSAIPDKDRLMAGTVLTIPPKRSR
ncbi:MAG: tetratricopeptide repeat protein [Verrucomicrobiia bacterium]|jgi:tetratricopeptide (TPR) repeat protein